jgi:hypothetical protein
MTCPWRAIWSGRGFAVCPDGRCWLSVPGPEPDPCAGRRGLSEHERELVKRRVDTITGWQVCGDGVVAAAQVLHERLSGGNGAGGG